MSGAAVEPRCSRRQEFCLSVPERAQGNERIRISRSACLCGILVLVLLAATEMYEWLGEYNQAEWFFAGGFGLLLIGSCRWALRLHWLSPVTIYMFVFWIFHFGLIFPVALVPEILDELPEWIVSWLSQSDVSFAGLLCLLYLASFSFGILSCWRQKRPMQGVGKDIEPCHLAVTGWAVLLLGFMVMAASVFTHGLRVFWLSYDEFFLVHNAFSWSIVVMAYGLLLQIAGGRPTRAVMVTSLWSYVPVVLLAFLAGARTAPLFTFSVLLALLISRGLRVPSAAICVGVALLLCAIATVREFREVGVLSTLEAAGTIEVQSPVSGIVELGGSLAPVVATIDYMRNSSFFFGETYLYPFVRQFQRLAGLPRADEHSEPKFIAETINDIYGSIGYSTVAEAFANGGAIGVILFAFLWGASLSCLDRMSNTPYGLAVLGAVLIPMLINVRNSFVYVPAWILLGLIPLAVSWILDKQGANPRIGLSKSKQTP
jgi:hypothetical protein